MCADGNQFFCDPAKIIRDLNPLVEETCLEVKPAARVLDLGSGAGRYLLRVSPCMKMIPCVVHRKPRADR